VAVAVVQVLSEPMLFKIQKAAMVVRVSHQLFQEHQLLAVVAVAVQIKQEHLVVQELVAQVVAVAVEMEQLQA
jgi:hypothetical protein